MKLSIIPLCKNYSKETFAIYKNYSNIKNLKVFLIKFFNNNFYYKKFNIIIAIIEKKYVHGCYEFNIGNKNTYYIDQIVIPGPLARQTILKKFIEYIYNDCINKNCTKLVVNNIKTNDWKYLFFKELGAVSNKNLIQIDL